MGGDLRSRPGDFPPRLLVLLGVFQSLEQIVSRVVGQAIKVFLSATDWHDVRQPYDARLLENAEVVVRDSSIRRPKSIARRIKRARQDSNLWPCAPEAHALSS